MRQEKNTGTISAGDEYKFFGKYADLLRGEFDYVIIDCPPNLYNVTKNALCHSDYVLIPCIPDTLSTLGLGLLIHEMETVVNKLMEAETLERPPYVLGVIISRFKPTLKVMKSGITTINSVISSFHRNPKMLVNDKTQVFVDQPVRDYTAHAQSVQSGKPLCLSEPGSHAYADVKALTLALLEAMKG